MLQQVHRVQLCTFSGLGTFDTFIKVQMKIFKYSTSSFTLVRVEMDYVHIDVHALV